MSASTVSPFLAIDDAAKDDPDRLFARFGSQDITCGDLLRWSNEIGRVLVGAGLKEGDRVAVMMSNRPLVLALIFGIAKAGMIWVPVNTRQQGDSLAHIFGNCAPALLIADADLAEVVKTCGADISSLRAVFISGDCDEIDLPGDASNAVLLEAPDPQAVFSIMYTSGTTGQPKGVQVTHRMFEFAARSVSMVADVRNDDVIFVWEPLFHIGGSQLLLLPLMFDVHLHMVPRFSASRFWEQVRESGATHIHYLGGVLQILLRQPPSELDRQHRVRIAWGGGCRPDDWLAFEQRFGVDIRESYGMTEASSITTCNVGGPVGSVGRPVPWFEVELLDPQGRAVVQGERGEIVVSALEKGALFAGYLDDPGATEKALFDGKLHTGDAGSFDADGYLVFHGRLNDSVRRRGENISAWEIEHVALQHPGVAEAAMVGVKADIGEQEIKLFVVRQEGYSVTAHELFDWLATRLGEYRTPRYIAFVDGFPKTPSERVRKGLLSRNTDDSWDREKPEADGLARSA